jgi:predicted transcriptional regulator of viral defense system
VSNPTTRLLDLVDRFGLVRARDAANAGIPTVYLTRLVRAGALERVARGLYARASSSVGEHVRLAEFAKLAHRADAYLTNGLPCRPGLRSPWLEGVDHG